MRFTATLVLLFVFLVPSNVFAEAPVPNVAEETTTPTDCLGQPIVDGQEFPVDLGCGCGEPAANECGCGSYDLGCGCGNPAPGPCGCEGDAQCDCSDEVEFECPPPNREICIGGIQSKEHFGVAGLDWWIFRGNFQDEHTWGNGGDWSYFGSDYCELGDVVCGCQRTQGCFATGTNILMADGTTKLVEKLRAGDKVLNPLSKKAVAIKTIIEGGESLPLIRISSGERSITVSQEHPMRRVETAGIVRSSLNVDRPQVDFIRARDIKVGQILLSGEGTPLLVDAVEQLPVADGQFVINVVLDAPEGDRQGHFLVADGYVTGDLIIQTEK